MSKPSMDAQSRKQLEARFLAVLADYSMANPCPRPILAEKIGCDVRTVSDLAVSLVKRYEPVCSSNDGFYLGKTIEEIREGRNFKMRRFLDYKEQLDAYEFMIDVKAAASQGRLL